MAMSTDPSQAPSILRNPTRLAPLSMIAMFIWVKLDQGGDGRCNGVRGFGVRWRTNVLLDFELLRSFDGNVDIIEGMEKEVYLDIKFHRFFDGSIQQVHCANTTHFSRS